NLGDGRELLDIDIARLRAFTLAHALVVPDLDAHFGDRLCPAGMNDDTVHEPDSVHLDLGIPDRSHMHAGLEPLLEKDGVLAAGCAQSDIRALEGGVRLIDGLHVDIQHAAHLFAESLAPLAIGAEASDQFDVANG